MTIQRPVALFLLHFLFYPLISAQPRTRSMDTTPFAVQEKIAPGMLAGDSTELDVPNVFTPNGDNINDYFIVDTDGTTIYEFSIFTRTGTRIYFSKSPQISWDGKSIGGKELPEGIYYYVIERAEGGDTPVENAGFIFLFR